MTPEQLRRQLEYFRDLGFEFVYRRNIVAYDAPGKATSEEHIPVGVACSDLKAGKPQEQDAGRVPLEDSGVASRPAVMLPGLAATRDSLLPIRQDLIDCRRCRLCEQRKTIGRGAGNEAAKLVFVGEGPGADEDDQGLPFVGRAGQLLTQMIDNTAQREGIPIRREDVYICNVVKCRPPENRTPLPEEMETCGQFLY